MAAKENFFKAMKELTGIGGAEEVQKPFSPPFKELKAQPKDERPASESAMEQPTGEGLEVVKTDTAGGNGERSNLVQLNLDQQIPTQELQEMEDKLKMEEQTPFWGKQAETAMVGEGTEQKSVFRSWPPQQQPAPSFRPEETEPQTKPEEPQGSDATIISSSMVITGEVKSTGNLQVLGMIKGPARTCGNIEIRGKILGDIEGNNLTLKGCAIQGCIVAAGNVDIDAGSVVVGDVKAANLTVNGKIKGNLTVTERLELNKESRIDGDASSHFISMSQGAKLKGNVSVASDDSGDEEIFDIEFDV